MNLKTSISNRHVHLSKKDLEILFGENYKLTFYRRLLQPGHFKAKEKLILSGKEDLEISIVGPLRDKTTVEILKNDNLGKNVFLKNKDKKVKVNSIVDKPHIHLNPKSLEKINKKFVKIKFKDNIINNVEVKKGKNEFHINKDQALKYNLKNNDIVEIV